MRAAASGSRWGTRALTSRASRRHVGCATRTARSSGSRGSPSTSWLVAASVDPASIAGDAGLGAQVEALSEKFDYQVYPGTALDALDDVVLRRAVRLPVRRTLGRLEIGVVHLGDVGVDQQIGGLTQGLRFAEGFAADTIIRNSASIQIVTN